MEIKIDRFLLRGFFDTFSKKLNPVIEKMSDSDKYNFGAKLAEKLAEIVEKQTEETKKLGTSKD